MSRAIEKLVAEKLMGWNRSPAGDWSHQANRIWSVSEQQIPHYSTDIRQAWNVVEKMRVDGFGYEIRAYSQAPIVSFYCPKGPCDDGHEGQSTDGRVPLAICIAALRAVGVAEDVITAALKETP